MATWKKVVVSGSSAALSALTLDTALPLSEGGTGATDASGARTALGLGTAATTAASAYATSAQGTKADDALPAANVSTYGGTLIDDADASAARTTLGLGTAATTAASDYATSAQGTKADDALPAANVSTYGGTLIDDADASAARTTLGLGSVATLNSVSLTSNVAGTLPTANGGLGFVPTISLANASKVIKVKSDGSGFELADDAASSVTPTSTTTFTNKTIDLTDNTVTGTLAEFNSAVSDATLASLAGSEILTNKTIDSDSNTITNIVNADIKASAAIAFSKMADLTVSRALVSDTNGDVSVSDVTSTEIGYLDGVSSAIQTQINGKQASGDYATNTALTTGLSGKEDSITGAATTITGADLTVSRALASDANGKVAVATTTLAELNFVNGVTSAIQTQLNSKIGTNNNNLTGTTTIDVLSVTGNATLGSDAADKVTVNGDLIVKGTASFESTENLLVKDRFITLASGSSSDGDGGIVVETSTANGGQGPAFAWNGTDDRWGVAQTVQSDASSYSADAFMASVLKPAAANTAAAILAIDSNYNKKGNLYVASGQEDIWIYS